MICLSRLCASSVLLVTIAWRIQPLTSIPLARKVRIHVFFYQQRHFLICILGAYCLNATESPYQYECPAGTYNNRAHADDAFDCIPCPREFEHGVKCFSCRLNYYMPM
jgi:hypothetical protein